MPTHQKVTTPLKTSPFVSFPVKFNKNLVCFRRCMAVTVLYASLGGELRRFGQPCNSFERSKGVGLCQLFPLHGQLNDVGN